MSNLLTLKTSEDLFYHQPTNGKGPRLDKARRISVELDNEIKKEKSHS
jgi:hypothetical protein